MNEDVVGWRNPWIWALPVVAIAAIALLWNGTGNGQAFLAINGIGFSTPAALWANITVLGDSLVVLALVLVLAGRSPRILWAFVIAALFATFAVHGCKEWLNLYRPPAVFAPHEINVIGPAFKAVSFPSGHTTAIFTLVALLCLQRGLGMGVKTVLLVVASAVGISRIVVGVHWPTDVLGGAAIGWASAAAGLWLAPRIPWGLTPAAQRLFAALLVAAVLLLFFHDSGYPQAKPFQILVALGALSVAFPRLRQMFRDMAQERKARSDAPREDEPAAKPKFGMLLVRIAITVLIFVLIFRSMDLKSVMEVMQDMVPRLLGLALIFQIVSTALASYRWNLVMQPLGFPMPFGFYLRSYFKGSFFNQGLPTSIGGDAIRVLDVARQGYRKREAFYGVFIDRVLGLVGLLILNLAANLAAPDLLPKGVGFTINAIVLAGLAGFATLFALRHIGVFERQKLLRPLHHVSHHLVRVLRHPRDALLQTGLSLCVHALSLIAIFLIGRSVGMTYDLTTFMVVVPPVILLTLVPISLAGWGVREGAMIGLFTLLGASKAVVLSMSVLYGVVLVLSSLPGFYVYLIGRHKL